MTDIPKESPQDLATRDVQRDKHGLWERLFGSRGEAPHYERFVCGPGRRSACIEVERGRQR